MADKPTKDSLSDFVEARDLNKLKEWGNVEGLATKLGTNVTTGLPKSEIDSGFSDRIAQYGANVFPQRDPVGFFELFFEALQDRTIIILIFSAVFSIFLGVFVEQNPNGWIEGTAIIVAVLVVATVTAGNDYSKEKQFRKLNAISEDRQIKVIRDGNQQVVSIHEIQVGEVVLLETGDKICADGLLVESDELKCDESSMTGEIDAVKKIRDKDPFLLCGCQIMEGRGKMITVAIGPNSQWGKIKALIVKDSQATPLQEHLEELAETIGKMGLVAAGFTFISLVIQWFSHLQSSGHEFQLSDLAELVEFLITAITIVVVAVPEGLPLAVTISLAYSMFKMMKDNNLVRHLEACETMGGATNICSDKTGTLTENRMTVVRAWVAGKMYPDIPRAADLSTAIQKNLVEGIATNSTAYIVKKESDREEFIGSKTECALLQFAEKLGANYTELRQTTPAERMYPFSSAKKSMSTILKKAPTASTYRIYTKGASEIILGMSTTFVNEQGNVVPINAETVKVLQDQITEMASNGLRTIGLAYSDIPAPQDWNAPQEKNLTLLAICGIKDPVRAEVPAAVKACQTAGITVRMLTGDNILTAKHIARECGILTENGVAIEGPDFRQLTQEEVDAIIPRLQVMARCSPQDKFRLVHRLRELGEVVAVTGDGTNDAPQLKEADVGFAMGIAGTEVAKEASDIILLDDNFSSIVKAVMWGRNVYDSIRKFVQFQLTVNVVAVIIAFIGAVSKGESPLKPVQMLWVNLIMDTMAALALATEAPTPELLKRKPYGRFEGIITPAMWRNIVGQATFQIIVLVVLLYFPSSIPQLGLNLKLSAWTEYHHTLQTTIIFNTFVFCQLFNEINSRKLGNELNVLSGIFSNLTFWVVMIFTVSVQYAIVQFGGEFAAVTALTKEQWIACVAVGAISIPWGMILRFIPMPTGANPEVVIKKEDESIRHVKRPLTFQDAGMAVMRANSFLTGVRRRRVV
eukprot:CAMPEP_0168558174 /NCGR_PEP_ID=MMETSP0413-20121227/9825_1 /TAXON_ID=136452 /ORGANISM="Filamoeba nolandi, Strain NC-AS-23-1" /LENGTH=976 /DNA_ID=CAMNT_0008589269 /DNA_START=36 /DNA_END=2966 /DNA_ORIENTATION=-